MHEVAKNLDQATQQATGQYYRLVILVGPAGSEKTGALATLAEKLHCPVINVNQELGRRLLTLSRAQRPRQVERLLKEIMASIPGEMALLDNLEILFDTQLQVEPLRLLQVISRNRTVVAAWSGAERAGTLTYAEPGHPEYAQFKQAEAILVPIVASAVP